MNKAEQTIENISEALRFMREMWISTKCPVWSGDVHDFMANVIEGQTTVYDVVRILTSISEGDFIEELQGVYVHRDRHGKIQRIDVRSKPLTRQQKNPLQEPCQKKLS